jgi:hypothetical protein
LLKNSFSEDQLEEMRGIADGSEQKWKWVFLGNILFEIATALEEELKVMGACSGFINFMKDSNQAVLGKTTDLNPPLADFFTKNTVVFIYDYPDLEMEYMTPSFPILIAGDSVVFEDGSVVAANGGGFISKSVFYDFRRAPILSIMKEVAKTNGDLNQAKETIRNHQSIGPFLYFFSDGSKEGSFTMEAGSGSYLRKLDQHLIYTNHLLSESLIKKNYHPDYLSDKHFLNSKARYKNIEDQIGKALSAEGAIEVLKIHSEDFKAIQGSISNLGTISGMVVLPKEKKILLPSGDKVPVTFYGKWVEFDLDDLFNYRPN